MILDSAKEKCKHCGLDCLEVYKYQENSFCCNGCLAAHRSIKENGLDYFYDLRDELLKKSKPAIQKQSDFSFLDDVATSSYFLNKEGYFTFYIEGMQCAACVWLLESLSQIKPEILNIRLHYLDHTIEIFVEEEAKASDIIQFVESFGYKLKAIKNDETIHHFQNAESKKKLNQIAVAAVCSGNIMILSFADYFGADWLFQKSFRWLSFALFLPILFYSAKDILINSYRSMLRFKPSLDLPISVALSAGFLLSFISLLLETGHIYFDSLAVTVFLILSSRYLIQSYKENILRNLHGVKSLIPDVSKKASGKYVLSEDIQQGDLLLVEKKQTIPCDAIVVNGKAWINEAVLSGEANLRSIKAGDFIFAGSHIENGSVEIRSLKTSDESRFAKLIDEAQHKALFKSQMARFEEKFSYYFTLTCVAISLLLVVYFYSDIQTGFERALALLIVACPCAISFGSPLIYARSIKFLAKFKIFLKNIGVLDHVESIQNLIFDKTGTLTKSSFQVKNIEFKNKQIQDIILAIQSKSDHPIARAICNHFPFYESKCEVESLQLITAKGIQAKVAGQTYKISHNNEEEDLVRLSFFHNDKKVGSAVLSEEIKTNINQITKTFKKKTFHIISGDKAYLVKRVAHYANISKYKHGMSPEQKEAYIKERSNSMMIGDGINDSAAIAAADVGVSVTGSLTNAFQNADVLLLSDDILSLQKLWLTAKVNKKAHKNLFLFSIIYNSLAATLAILGYIQPVVAAILMPLSSILVLFCVHFSTRGYNWE